MLEMEQKPLNAENKVENKVERPQNKHLIPLKPGQTANPNGRPLGQKNYATLYKEALIKLAKLNDKEPEEIEAEIISKGILSARGGDYRFYKDVLDRLHGTAVNKSEFSGELKLTMADVLKRRKDENMGRRVVGQVISDVGIIPDTQQEQTISSVQSQQSPAALPQPQVVEKYNPEEPPIGVHN